MNEQATGRFREVYARHYPDVVRYGLRRLHGMTAAEELATVPDRRPCPRASSR